MKKRHLIISAMVCCAVMGTPGTAMSQMSETATKEVYDFPVCGCRFVGFVL